MLQGRPIAMQPKVRYAWFGETRTRFPLK